MDALNEILLRRKNKVIVKPINIDYKQTAAEKALVVAGLKNIQALGFTFSKNLLTKLFHFNRNEFEQFYFDLLPSLKVLVGADVQYNPMYPNFPQQVAKASDVELFVNAIIHYWSFGKLLPAYRKNERLPLIDDNKMTVLSVGNYKMLGEILNNLLKSPTSLSQNDKDDIETIIKNFSDYYKYFPTEIPLKETVAFVGKIIITQTPYPTIKNIKQHFKTATDVLRLIVALNDGDISLANKTRFKSQKRQERRMIMSLLANCKSDITEDLFRYRNVWLAVCRYLHPFEEDYSAEKYKNVRKAFDTLHNKKKPLFFAGKVQELILAKDILSAAELLKQRPGEFARQLDKLIRDSGEPYYIIQRFAEVAEKVSSPVLLQVRQHFIGRRDKTNPVRVFSPKGNLAKAMAIKNELSKIPTYISQQIIEVCEKALKAQYEKRGKMGKVYIDPEFKNYIIPFAQRSASKATKTLSRGSNISINQKTKAVRGFIWWTNADVWWTNTDDDRVDIDLSAAIYDENWNYVEHVSYTNLRSVKYQAFHSGDITDGGDINGDGVAEFLDVDIDSVARNAGRYIVYQVYSYTGQKFSELPNIRFGWMEREDVNSGEIFEPKTVRMKIDLTANSRTAIPVIFDCIERKFIWCDMNLGIDSSSRGGINLESNLHGVTATCYAMTHLNKPNLYDMIYLNAFARGEITNDRNMADIIFSNDETIPYKIVEEKDEVTGLYHRKLEDKPEVPIINCYDFDYFVGKLL